VRWDVEWFHRRHDLEIASLLTVDLLDECQHRDRIDPQTFGMGADDAAGIDQGW
jgi:hypothetical protein